MFQSLESQNLKYLPKLAENSVKRFLQLCIKIKVNKKEYKNVASEKLILWKKERTVDFDFFVEVVDVDGHVLRGFGVSVNFSHVCVKISNMEERVKFFTTGVR